MEERQMMALVRFGIDPDQVIHEEGRYWMTAEQLGIARGYKEPRKGVMKIYERHRKELQPFIRVAKLATPSAPDGRGGGVQEVTIFDTDGQYRIALLAKTPKAEKFRALVINMLKALERKEFIHISQVMKWRQELIELRISRYLQNSRTMDWDKYKKMLRYRQIGLSRRETAKLLDISADTVKRLEAVPVKYDIGVRMGRHLLKGGEM